MNTTYAHTPPDLVFPPQVPFSWTRRWARAHHDDVRTVTRRAYRIAGSGSHAELVAAIAFNREHVARLELE